MNLRENNLYSVTLIFEIFLDTKKWKTFLQEEGFKDTKLKSDSSESVWEFAAKEDLSKDYHLHLRVRKYIKRKKEKFVLYISLHADDEDLSIEKRDEKKFWKEGIYNWLLNLLPNNLKDYKIKATLTARYEYNNDNYSLISDLPLNKNISIDDKNEYMGEMNLTGIKIDFKNSMIGIDFVAFESTERILRLTQSYKTRINLKEKYFDDFIMISNRISSLFVKEV